MALGSSTEVLEWVDIAVPHWVKNNKEAETCRFTFNCSGDCRGYVFHMRKILAGAAGFLIALSAGAGVASASLGAAELQEMISSKLAGLGGTAPEAVQCPGDLTSEIGSSITCAVTVDGETRGLTITVVSVDNGQLNLSMTPARQ